MALAFLIIGLDNSKTDSGAFLFYSYNTGYSFFLSGLVTPVTNLTLVLRLFHFWGC